MGRRRKGKSVEVKLLIPEPVYLRFEQALTANFSKLPEYGVRSQIVTKLIADWLDVLDRAREAGSSGPQPEPREEPPHVRDS